MFVDPVGLEEQIAALKDCGIEPVSSLALKYIVDEFDREYLESKPYDHLLAALGCEYEDSQGVWGPASPHISRL